MLQSIIKGLALGAFLALAPVAAFLLWLSSAWWVLPIIGGALVLMVVVGVGEALGWRWACWLGRFIR